MEYKNEVIQQVDESRLRIRDRISDSIISREVFKEAGWEYDSGLGMSLNIHNEVYKKEGWLMEYHFSEGADNQTIRVIPEKYDPKVVVKPKRVTVKNWIKVINNVIKK